MFTTSESLPAPVARAGARQLSSSSPSRPVGARVAGGPGRTRSGIPGAEGWR